MTIGTVDGHGTVALAPRTAIGTVALWTAIGIVALWTAIGTADGHWHCGRPLALWTATGTVDGHWHCGCATLYCATR